MMEFRCFTFFLKRENSFGKSERKSSEYSFMHEGSNKYCLGVQPCTYLLMLMHDPFWHHIWLVNPSSLQFFLLKVSFHQCWCHLNILEFIFSKFFTKKCNFYLNLKQFKICLKGFNFCIRALSRNNGVKLSSVR